MYCRRYRSDAERFRVRQARANTPHGPFARGLRFAMWPSKAGLSLPPCGRRNALRLLRPMVLEVLPMLLGITHEAIE
jgi:hypothetical protein